jgi:hypothetical protein
MQWVSSLQGSYTTTPVPAKCRVGVHRARQASVLVEKIDIEDFRALVTKAHS